MGSEEGPDAVERDDTDEGASEVGCRVWRWALFDDGAGRAARDQPQDGIQVGGTIRAGGAGRVEGPVAGAEEFSAPDARRDRRWSAGDAAATSPMGAQEVDR